MANPSSRGQQRDKPFRDALRMEEKELAGGNKLDHPPGSLRWNAQNLLLIGKPDSIREIADRLDGKVPDRLINESSRESIPKTLDDMIDQAYGDKPRKDAVGGDGGGGGEGPTP